jgi:hypothetical protein
MRFSPGPDSPVHTTAPGTRLGRSRYIVTIVPYGDRMELDWSDQAREQLTEILLLGDLHRVLH